MTSPFGTHLAGVVGIGGTLLLVKCLNDLINQQTDIKKAKVEIIAGAVTLLVASSKIGYDFGCMVNSINKDIAAVQDVHSYYKNVFDTYANSTFWKICISNFLSVGCIKLGHKAVVHYTN